MVVPVVLGFAWQYCFGFVELGFVIMLLCELLVYLRLLCVCAGFGLDAVFDGLLCIRVRDYDWLI